MQLRLRLEACSLFAPFLVCGASGFVAPQAGASLERQPRGFRAGSLSARALQPRPASGNVLHESSSIRTFLIAQQRHACCNNRLTNAWALRMTVADGGGQNGNNGSGSPEATSPATDTEGKGIYGFDEEVIQTEAAEAPFRKLRLIAYGALAVTAIVLGGVSIAGLAGVEAVEELGKNLPNPLLDAAVLGLAFYLWVEEVKTKRSALRVIERQREEQSRVPNRTTRRLNKAGGRSKTSAKKTFKKDATIAASAAAATASQQPASEGREGSPASMAQTPPANGTSDAGEVAEGDEETSDGFFGGMRKTLESVNQQSYYQALALNKELEDKGVLPRLERKPEPPSPGDDGVVGETAGSLEVEAVEDNSAGGGGVDVADVVEREVISERGVGKRRGKRGKKGKRKR